MKRGMVISAIILVVSLTTFNGCLGVDHQFRSVRNDLISVSGSNYTRDIEFSLGSFELGVVQKLVKFDNSDREAKEIIKHVSEVQIGVYKNHSGEPFKDKFRTVRNIDRKMTENGWIFLVKSYRGNKMELVYIKHDDSECLSAMFVVNLKPGKLEMVEVHGELEKILAYVIKDKGLNAQFADAGN